MRTFVGDFVEVGLHRRSVEFFAVGKIQDGLVHLVPIIQPPMVVLRLHDERHAIVDAAHRFVRRGGEDEKAHFGDRFIVRLGGDDVPEAGEAERFAAGFGESDGVASRTGLFPLVKAIGRDEAALVDAFAKGAFGQDGFSLGVDEGALVPGN